MLYFQGATLTGDRMLFHVSGSDADRRRFEYYLTCFRKEARMLFYIFQEDLGAIKDIIMTNNQENSVNSFLEVESPLRRLIIKNEFLRPSYLSCSKAYPSKAKKELSWEAEFKMEDIVQKMLDYEIKHIQL